jgi:23S rRNA (pseudouridine1915-N3)-methyltransferase
MRLPVYAFGKLRTPGLREAADHYKKLLGTWIDLDEVELKSQHVSDKSPATRKKIQEQEGEMLLERLGKTPFYLLDETGKALSTQAWVDLVAQPGIAFCVGGSLGFSDALRRAAKGAISLGPQTLPHELARVVLFEQLYRAWSVTRGHPYHNEGS